MILIKFRGIENPEQTNLLRNSYLMIDREEEKPLEEGTYYIVDMIGMDVYTDEGEKLGNIEDIFNTGSNDIYVVKSELGKQILLPAISDVVKNIDMENKKNGSSFNIWTNLMEEKMKFDVLTFSRYV